MGAAVGAMVSGWFRSSPRERRMLIAAGSGAGLAAAFNAPLAGLVFVLEEIQRDFAPGVFATTLIAAATADVTTRLILANCRSSTSTRWRSHRSRRCRHRC
jgi:CIC family chloride channel protein